MGQGKTLHNTTLIGVDKMEPVLIDTNRTFGVELEGLVNCDDNRVDIYDINTRDSPYYCECECIDGCTGECTGECYCADLCECDELHEQLLAENPYVTHAEVECDYCKGEAVCSYCEGDCECGYCTENCDCPSCTYECECDTLGTLYCKQHSSGVA